MPEKIKYEGRLWFDDENESVTSTNWKNLILKYKDEMDEDALLEMTESLTDEVASARLKYKFSDKYEVDLYESVELDTILDYSEFVSADDADDEGWVTLELEFDLPRYIADNP